MILIEMFEGKTLHSLRQEYMNAYLRDFSDKEKAKERYFRGLILAEKAGQDLEDNYDYIHSDFHAGNIILKEDSEGNIIEAKIIDVGDKEGIKSREKRHLVYPKPDQFSATFYMDKNGQKFDEEFEKYSEIFSEEVLKREEDTSYDKLIKKTVNLDVKEPELDLKGVKNKKSDYEIIKAIRKQQEDVYGNITDEISVYTLKQQENRSDGQPIPEMEQQVDGNKNNMFKERRKDIYVVDNNDRHYRKVQSGFLCRSLFIY